MERNYKIPEQTWRRNGSCPDGTVPIRRMPANVNREVASTNHSFRLFGRPTGETVQDEANGKEEVSPLDFLLFFHMNPYIVHFFLEIRVQQYLWFCRLQLHIV